MLAPTRFMLGFLSTSLLNLLVFSPLTLLPNLFDFISTSRLLPSIRHGLVFIGGVLVVDTQVEKNHTIVAVVSPVVVSFIVFTSLTKLRNLYSRMTSSMFAPSRLTMTA